MTDHPMPTPASPDGALAPDLSVVFDVDVSGAMDALRRFSEAATIIIQRLADTLGMMPPISPVTYRALTITADDFDRQYSRQRVRKQRRDKRR